MVRLKFKKRSKLLNHKNFSFVLENPYIKKVNGVVLFGKLNNLNIPRIGIIISKKYIKKSNVRNRVKRIIRENFRLNQIYIPNMDFVVSIKSKMDKISNQNLNKILENLWEKYHQIFPNS